MRHNPLRIGNCMAHLIMEERSIKNLDPKKMILMKAANSLR